MSPHLFHLFTDNSSIQLLSLGVLLEIFGGGVLPTSPNPDPISDEKMLFSTPVFRPGLKNPYPFSDHTLWSGTYLYT